MTSKKDKLFKVLSDNKPHTTYELIKKVWNIRIPCVAGLHQRISDLRKEGWTIVGQKSKKNHMKYWYCMRPNGAILFENEVYKSIARCDKRRGLYE